MAALLYYASTGGGADSGHTQEVLQRRVGVLLGSIRQWSKMNTLRQGDISAMLDDIGRSLRRLVSIEQRMLDLETRQHGLEPLPLEEDSSVDEEESGSDGAGSEGGDGASG